MPVILNMYERAVQSILKIDVIRLQHTKRTFIYAHRGVSSPGVNNTYKKDFHRLLVPYNTSTLCSCSVASPSQGTPSNHMDSGPCACAWGGGGAVAVPSLGLVQGCRSRDEALTVS